MYQIGVDIGGTNIKIGLVDDALEIVARKTIPFPQTEGEVVAEQLAAAIRALLDGQGLTQQQVESIGIVIPGSIDTTGQTIIDAYNLGFHGVAFQPMMAKRFPGTPVYMANDANGAALAELYRGAFVGCKTAVLITLGTGVGGGIILNGKMFNGGLNQGVELGHMILVDDGESCTCGNAGCLEAYCSATGLARIAKRAMQHNPQSTLAKKCGGDASLVDARLLIDTAKEGDELANAVFSTYLNHLSSACASIFNLLDPEVLAIGGGVCGAGDFLFEPLQELVTQKCFYKTRGKLVPAVMGNDAGIVGAAMLRRDAQR